MPQWLTKPVAKVGAGDALGGAAVGLGAGDAVALGRGVAVALAGAAVGVATDVAVGVGDTLTTVAVGVEVGAGVSMLLGAGVETVGVAVTLGVNVGVVEATGDAVDAVVSRTENAALLDPPEVLPPGARPFLFGEVVVDPDVALTECVPTETPLGTRKVVLNVPLPLA